METKIYEKLERPIGNYKELSINVDYYLGGMNYFSGGFSKRGVYLYLTPVSRNSGMISSTLMGSGRDCGYRILLEELKRKSQKHIDTWGTKVVGLSKQIADLYLEEEDQKIVQLVRN